jgi:hypothetical protein
MKRRIGGEKFTAREKLTFHWYPTPGCNMHKEIIGNRRGGILFEHYVKLRGSKANLLYWRTHPMEWKEILRRVRM